MVRRTQHGIIREKNVAKAEARHEKKALGAQEPPA
jgi:hypothetical protein